MLALIWSLLLFKILKHTVCLSLTHVHTPEDTEKEREKERGERSSSLILILLSIEGKVTFFYLRQKKLSIPF